MSAAEGETVDPISRFSLNRNLLLNPQHELELILHQCDIDTLQVFPI